MANAGALIREPLWRDTDFRKLPRLAQCTYMHLLSLKDLDCAGVITVNLKVWIKGCDALTVAAFKADLEALEALRFVFVDYETDELLIRSYVRLVSVRSPNAWKSAKKAALLIESEKIRSELATELRRLRRSDADEVAEQINPSGPPLDPIRNPSEGDNPSETHSEPPSSVPVPVPESLNVVGHLGGGDTPRPHCSKHDENHEGPCHACRLRREWDEANADRLAADELERKRAEKTAAAQALKDCPLCDSDGWARDSEGAPTIKCTHQRESRHA